MNGQLGNRGHPQAPKMDRCLRIRLGVSRPQHQDMSPKVELLRNNKLNHTTNGTNLMDVLQGPEGRSQAIPDEPRCKSTSWKCCIETSSMVLLTTFQEMKFPIIRRPLLMISQNRNRQSRSSNKKVSSVKTVGESGGTGDADSIHEQRRICHSIRTPSRKYTADCHVSRST